jgi:Uncharacterized protein conserved in bacteria (DUF2188)
MPKKGDVHVVHDDDSGKWRVEVEGQTRASGTSDTKQPAVDLGRRVAERNHSDLLIHNKDGQIGRRDSHGRDPHPPKG